MIYLNNDNVRILIFTTISIPISISMRGEKRPREGGRNGLHIENR